MNSEQQHTAYQLRHALEENLDQLPVTTADRLAAARKLAIARKKKSAVSSILTPRVVADASGAGLMANTRFWLGRLGLALPLLVLVAGLAALFQSERQRRIDDIADFDVAVLTDVLPPSAYLDQGFHAYLNQRSD